tara:strand:+ start:782 stop:1000 length:219 start_codon:yes stop_codon:yes gene_type:complete
MSTKDSVIEKLAEKDLDLKLITMRNNHLMRENQELTDKNIVLNRVCNFAIAGFIGIALLEVLTLTLRYIVSM